LEHSAKQSWKGYRNMSRVLFVEDSPTWRDILKETLETAGHETKHAPTLDGAIELLNSKNRIDVIVFDLHLGTKRDNRNKYVNLEALKDGLEARKIPIPPIIIVTGISVDPKEVRQCFSEYRGIVYDFFEKTGFEDVEKEFLQSVKKASVTKVHISTPRSFFTVLGYTILLALVVVLIIGILFWSVNQISDPKTQQVFLEIGGALIIVFVIFVLMFSQSTKIEDIIGSITKIWRNS
jgi:CheY-like chemotaxis protein